MRIRITIEMPQWIERIFVRPILEYRRRRYGFAFRRIPLTMGLFAIVDPEDYFPLSKYDWFAVQSGATYYAMRNDFTGYKYALVSMHRQVLPTDKGLVVDHRNGNGLDELKANLRAITKAQNQLNCRKRANSSSKFKGVWWIKGRKKWGVRLKFQGKIVLNKKLSSEIEAARAYDEAAKKYHGEFAKLNFPEEIERSPRRLNLRLANWLGAQQNFSVHYESNEDLCGIRNCGLRVSDCGFRPVIAKASSYVIAMEDRTAGKIKDLREKSINSR